MASRAGQKELEHDQSSVEVECVLSATAHELRLPLSHIKGFVSTLLRPDVEWDEGTKREFLAQIERETDRLSLLVDELMEPATAPDRRPQSLQRTPRAPLALVAGGMDRVYGTHESRSVVVDVPADLPMVEVDGSDIERVIANLLHNALKYAPSDSDIRLTGRAIDGWLELRVEDDGPGIPPRDREHIFRRFFRTPDAEASGRPGNGLGLAICQSIVSAHGGRIWADARPAGGTRFTVALPLAPAHSFPDVNGRQHRTRARWPSTKTRSPPNSSRQARVMALPR